LLEPTLTVAFILLAAVPMAHERPNLMNLRGIFAQTIVDELRPQLFISHEVQVKLVKYHPLVFSVEPMDSHRRRFRLSIEVGFLSTIDDEELYAALAHEMGHVWVYTHHPYLQTERLANTIGQTVVRRSSFEKVYAKLWAYEHSPGVPLEELLGPEPPAAGSGPASTSGAN
jgi:hypothetical protein